MPAVRPRPGDFGLISTLQGPWYDRWAARTIDAVTDSRFHHAILYIGQHAGGGRGDIVEAVRRVHIDWADQYDDITWSTARLPAHLTPTDDQRAAIVAAAKAMVGDRYNTLDLLAVGLAQKRMGHLVDGDEWWVKRLSADGREICSQLVDKAYLAAGIHLFADGRLPGLVSPGDLGALLLPE